MSQLFFPKPFPLSFTREMADLGLQKWREDSISWAAPVFPGCYFSLSFSAIPSQAEGKTYWSLLPEPYILIQFNVASCQGLNSWVTVQMPSNSIAHISKFLGHFQGQAHQCQLKEKEGKKSRECYFVQSSMVLRWSLSRTRVIALLSITESLSLTVVSQNILECKLC